MDESLQDRVLGALWPPGARSDTRIWVVLDAARDERIYPALLASRLDYVSLYGGRLPEALKRAAPYMVELAPTYSFTRPLIEMGWGNSWGIFLSIKDASNLRHHLRGFLRARDESARMLLFRYYDPRVLRAYLPTCRLGELTSFFGPVGSYFAESDRGTSLIEFQFDGQRLSERRTSLIDSTTSAEYEEVEPAQWMGEESVPRDEAAGIPE
jgi:hypothetical protein